MTPHDATDGRLQRDHTEERETGAAEASLLAVGGGNATAAGVSFQATLGAALAALAIAERRLDSQLDVTGARIRSLRFETEAPLDDILIETTETGFIFAQAKTSLTLSKKLDSEFGKTAEQIVRQWIACATGDGSRGWDRPLSLERDAIVIAVGPDTSGTILKALAPALARLRRVTAPADVVPQAEKEALERFAKLLAAAWESVIGNPPATGELDRLLPLVRIARYDLAGADRALAIEILRESLADGDDSEVAFSALAVACERHMAMRTGDDGAGFRRALAGSGIRLFAAPDYRADVDALNRYSERIQVVLAQYERISIGGEEFAIDRQCTAGVTTAAQQGSLLLIGEPGAGKSAVMNAAATALRQAGHPVVELAVDRLPVEGLDGLRIELGLAHPVRDVLANWPGVEPAFLVIDALDASRGSASEAVFRHLLEEVLALPGGRWRVVASIRSFDLRVGRQFRALFEGDPPDQAFADPAFSSVRHIHVPSWTEEELADLLNRAPALNTALTAGGDRVLDLARVPFNTRLLAELITGGLPPEALRALSSQADLLQLYWQHRVLVHGPGAELCLRGVIDEMIAARGLRATYRTAGGAGAAPLGELLHGAVLIAQDGNRYVAFRHHILFDYAASRLFLNPHDADELRTVLGRDRGLALLLAPALGYALQEPWTSGAMARSAYWSTLAVLIGDTECDPIARSVAARSVCELTRRAEDVDGFLPLLNQAANRSVLSQILGALSIRLEQTAAATPLDPWVRVAAAASEIAGLEESVRFLLWLLTSHENAPQHQDELGRAARRLLEAAFARGEADYSPRLAAAAIEFVANTYGSDPTASRALLERSFTPERFDLYAHHEVPWLTDRIESIAPVDPDFAAFIYSQVFARGVTSTAPTSMGQSQILPLTSNARQDYEMARYRLKEFFPRFLTSSPIEATQAMLLAIDGFVAAEHAISDDRGAWAIARGDEAPSQLKEDQSHIWAWDPDGDHLDDAEHLLNAFVRYLGEESSAKAVRLARHLIEHNSLGA